MLVTYTIPLKLTSATPPRPFETRSKRGGLPKSCAASSEAFKLLINMFGNLQCDLRASTFESFYSSFSEIKHKVEALLNATTIDRMQTAKNFNYAISQHRLQSREQLSFDVMASVNADLRVELVFMET